MIRTSVSFAFLVCLCATTAGLGAVLPAGDPRGSAVVRLPAAPLETARVSLPGAGAPSPEGAPSREGVGDPVVIAHHDACAYTGMVMNAGRNISTSTNPYTNGPDDYIAIPWYPRQFLAGSPTGPYGIDKVEFLFIREFAEGMTFPSISICPDNGLGSPGPVMDPVLCHATQQDFTPTGFTGPFEWREIPGLAGTVIADASRPFWVVLHLPPAQAAGLPFDCGIFKNCSDYVNGEGYLEVHRSTRWENLYVYSADDPDRPSEWLGPMTMICSDMTSSTTFNAICNVTLSAVSPTSPAFPAWNQSFVDVLIKCAHPGMYNPTYPSPAPCPDPTRLGPASDLVFLADWAVNGTMGVPLSSCDWEIYNVDTDPMHVNPPAFETHTVYNENGPPNCIESEPATWQLGNGTQVQISPYEDQLTWQTGRFPEGHYDACVKLTHRHCDETLYSPDPDELPFDNVYDNVVSTCVPFTVGVPGGPGPKPKAFLKMAPERGGRGGMVTAALHGHRFEDPMKVTLSMMGQADIEGAPVKVDRHGTSVSTVFNLVGAELGAWDVKLEFPDHTVLTSVFPFRVEDLVAPRTHIGLAGPAVVRMGATFDEHLSYDNFGNIDVGSPVMTVWSPEDATFKLPDGDRFYPGTTRVFGPGHSGFAGRLGPFVDNASDMKVVAPRGYNEIHLDADLFDSVQRLVDWNDLEQNGVPEGADAADWSKRVTQAGRLIGQCWYDVMQALRRIADEPALDPEPLYIFDRFLAYTVTIYGSTMDELADSAVLGPAAPTPMKGDLDPSAVTLITVQKPAAATRTYVVTHGLGSLCQDAHAQCACSDPCNPAPACKPDRFHQLADEVARVYPDANVYIVDWSAGSDKYKRLDGTDVPWPWAAAMNVDIAAAAASDLLRAEGVDHATTTLIGEDLGCYVNHRIAWSIGTVLGLQAFNPASEVGGYEPSAAGNARHSYSYHTDSVLDTQDPVGSCSLRLENPAGTTATERHTYGVKWLTERLCGGDTTWLEFGVTCSGQQRPWWFQGTALMNGAFDANPAEHRRDKLTAWNPTLDLVEHIERVVRVVGSVDPNGKAGADGVGAPRYISERGGLPYVVHFENLETATAPARTVVVTDTLDPALVDVRSFGLGAMGFGYRTVAPPAGAIEFTEDVDLRPEQNLVVRVMAEFKEMTGSITWTFEALDADTLQPPADPMAGFLPPNVDAPEGQGFVSFFVRPLGALPTETAIVNRASIVFDANPPIATLDWLNTLDFDPPVSRVEALPAEENCRAFRVSWTGSDAGSGIRGTSVFVSEDGGPSTEWLTTANETSALFPGEQGKTYAFFSTAEDAVWNAEGAPSSPDAATRVNITVPAVGNSLVLTRLPAGEIHARFGDVAPAPDDYVLIQDADARGPFVTVAGSGPDGATGITAMPPDQALSFFRVAARFGTDCIGP